MNKCPHCGKHGMALWKKILIGPNTMISCAQCGKPVAVSASSAWASIPLVPALFFALAAGDLATKIVVWVFCFFAGVLIKGFAIPIVRGTQRPHEPSSSRY